MARLLGASLLAAVSVHAQSAASTCVLREPGLACVKASSGGWLQLCPDQTTPEVVVASADGDPNCFRMRPYRYGLHEGGNMVEGSQAVNWQLSQPFLGTLSQNCSSGVCARRAGSGEPLQVYLIELNATNVLSINDALAVTVMIFKDDGELTYNDTTMNVQKGSFKWGLVVRRTDAAGATGGSTKVEFEVKPADNDRAITSAETIAHGLVVTGTMTNFPRFQAVTAEAVLWRTVEIGVSEYNGATLVTYDFPGPFLEASYDPLVARQTAEQDSAPTPLPQTGDQQTGGEQNAAMGAKASLGVSLAMICCAALRL